MTQERENLLNAIYQKGLDIGFGLLDEPDLSKYFAEKLLIIGTARDEVFDTIKGLQGLIDIQKEQGAGFDIRFEQAPVFRSYLAHDTVAIIVENIIANLSVDGNHTSFSMRCSSVLEFQQERWKFIHWHVSKPDNVESTEDTYGIAEWKEKNAALEKIVAERTLELTQQNEALEKTLKELRLTQDQLVQSEKMASLGELTAGIAHEIQNPLNFVNNFSEINKELLTEMKEAIAKKDFEEAAALAKDVIENEEKITHHGKRADAIVKGMLQHSRSSSAVKEPADINQLADEYLRLAYHGLRAKDKSFNATLKTEFDETLGKINVIPQDIGRVILNLITNAFYVVDEKRRQSTENGQPYEPTVTVKTSQNPPLGDGGAGYVLISVTDNGDGISQKILDKIFQPFFTTKPTGQGTGLGLSMSNDIVTKGHGGTLTVETKEGSGTTFTIILPA